MKTFDSFNDNEKKIYACVKNNEPQRMHVSVIKSCFGVSLDHGVSNDDSQWVIDSCKELERIGMFVKGTDNTESWYACTDSYSKSKIKFNF